MVEWMLPKHQAGVRFSLSALVIKDSQCDIIQATYSVIN